MRFRHGAVALIAVMAVVQVVTVRDETATWDEPVYLASGYSYWTTGRFDMIPEHPPLTRWLFALPLRLFFSLSLDTDSPEWRRSEFTLVGNLFLYRNNADPDTMLFAGRLVAIAIAIAFVVYLAWWTRRRFGDAAGLTALALIALDPNVIAHGRYVTSDVPVAGFGFAAVTLWLDYLREHHRRWWILTGVALGCALSSKFSALYLLPVLLAITAARPKARNFVAFAQTCLVALGVVAIVYLPEVVHSAQLPPLGDRITRAGMTGPLLSALAALRIPAYTFLTGIDWQSNHNAMGHPAYLLGQVSDRGWWYYFPVAFAVKTPAATIAGILLALGLVWRDRRRRLLLALLCPPAAYFALAMTSHIDIGIRHLLPVYPFLFVVVAAVLTGWKPRAALVAVALLAGETAAIYPDYLAFFNWPSGGPAAGPRYLLDSNLDWGQDYKKLARYLVNRGIRDIRLGFFANVDFAHYGIHADGIPDGANAESLDCILAMSATPLFGQYVGTERYAWLRALRPMAVIGHSIFVYDLRKNRAP